jgi:DnaJ-class molecular chaperone
MNHYEELGISKEATQEEIKLAYRKKAREHHPDKGGDKEDFQKVQKAYEILSDIDRKSAYDANGCSEEEPESAIIDKIITEVLINLLESNRIDTIYGDVVESLKSHFVHNQRNIKNNLTALKANNKKYCIVSKKIKAKNKFLFETIRTRRMQNIQNIRSLKQQYKVGQKVIEALNNGYSYDKDIFKPRIVVPQPQYSTSTATVFHI